MEIASSRAVAEEHAANSSKDITQDIDGTILLITQSDHLTWIYSVPYI